MQIYFWDPNDALRRSDWSKKNSPMIVLQHCITGVANKASKQCITTIITSRVQWISAG